MGSTIRLSTHPDRNGLAPGHSRFHRSDRRWMSRLRHSKPMRCLWEGFLLVRNLRVAAQAFHFQKATPMAFTSICPKSAVNEGGMGVFQAGKKSVLLVWPTGGELKAYRGRCPHADMPLNDATFNGKTITCRNHQWG